ncbi:MAG TPA: serine/threonine-protein kinase [Myxococcaceae bacterium]|nr:serine/threonine-protein kinase [Myxococcaceae bacterium]
MSDEKSQKPSADEVPEDERPTDEELENEDEASEELTPAQRRAFGAVMQGLTKLTRMISECDSTFSAGPISFRFVRQLEQRTNGLQVLLFERHLRHGPPGYVVVKRLLSPQSFELRHRLREEVQLAFRLHHPGIAQVHHFKVIEGQPHVVMEYVDGPTFDSLLSAAAMRSQPLPAPFALYVLAEVAEALHYAHTLTESEEGGRPLEIIHRDASPRNIRVSRKSGAVKLTDFGAAFSQRVGREETPEKLVKGDVLYASPEYLHQDPMDARSDIFCLGLVLLEALTSAHLFDLGHLPDTGAAPVNIVADEQPSVPLTQMMKLVDRYGPEDVERTAASLPAGLKAILHKALKRDPAQRYATAAELLQELRAQLFALAPGYGRKQAAEDVERLLSEASALRDVAEPVEPGLYPDGLEAHELTAGKAGGA